MTMTRIKTVEAKPPAGRRLGITKFAQESRQNRLAAALAKASNDMCLEPDRMEDTPPPASKDGYTPIHRMDVSGLSQAGFLRLMAEPVAPEGRAFVVVVASRPDGWLPFRLPFFHEAGRGFYGPGYELREKLPYQDPSDVRLHFSHRSVGEVLRRTKWRMADTRWSFEFLEGLRRVYGNLVDPRAIDTRDCWPMALDEHAAIYDDRQMTRYKLAALLSRMANPKQLLSELFTLHWLYYVAWELNCVWSAKGFEPYVPEHRRKKEAS